MCRASDSVLAYRSLIYPGKLPVAADETHYSPEGYITLGKFTASAVEEFYKAKE